MSDEAWAVVGALAALVLWAVLYVLLRRTFAIKPVRQYRDKEIKELARDFAETIDLTNRHFDRRRANEMTVRLPRPGRPADPTIQVNVRRDEEEPWGWAK